MRYTLDHNDNTATLTLHEERLDASNSADFKGELLIHCRSGIQVLFIDLSEVNFCDSSGLGCMLLAHREMKASGGATIFVSLTDRVNSLVELAQLDRILYIYPNREEALADLEGDDSEEESDEDFLL